MLYYFDFTKLQTTTQFGNVCALKLFYKVTDHNTIWKCVRAKTFLCSSFSRAAKTSVT